MASENFNSGSSHGSGFSEPPATEIRVSINGSNTQTSVDSLIQKFLDADDDDFFFPVDLDQPGPSSQFGGAQFELNGSDTKTSVDSLIQKFFDADDDDLFLPVDLDNLGPSKRKCALF